MRRGSWFGRARLVVCAAVACVAFLASGAGARVPDDGRLTALAASCGTDEFEGTTLDDARWDVLNPDAAGLSVAGGKLNLQLGTGDLIGGTANAQNVVIQDAPAGGWIATTEFNIQNIDANGEQAGLALWRSEGTLNNTVAKATFIQTNAGVRGFEAIYTDRSELAIPIPQSGTGAVTVAPDADVQMRMRSDGSRVVSEYSLDDGATWNQIGQAVRLPGPGVRVGLFGVRGGGSGGVVPYERFELACGPEVGVAADDASGEAPLTVNLTGAVSEAGATLAWDFGDGETATGGTTQTHTFDDPGTYRVELRATGANGVVTVGSTTVAALADDPPCPAGSDEFGGNALDPKWEVLRPVPTTLDVSGGNLRLRALGGDMSGTNATARNVLLQPAPSGAWTIATKIDVSQLTATGDQVGLIMWRGEGTGANNFAKLVFNRRSGTEWWVERSSTVNSSTSGQGNGNTGPLTPVPGTVYLRAVADDQANPSIQAQYSLDGESWTAVQAPFQVGGTGPLKVGLTYFQSSAMRVAAFDWFSLDAGETCGPDTTAPSTTAQLNPTQPGPGGTYSGPVGVTLSASDNPGGSGIDSTEYRVDDGQFQPYTGQFTVTGDGDHTVEFRSTDNAGNVEATKSVSFSISACAAPGAPEEGFERIWNGLDATGWSQAGPGRFDIVNDGAAGCRLVSRGGLGLFWFNEQQYDEFVLRLQWKTVDATDNSGVFVRFPNPGNDPGVAINQGHEIQIREGVQGDGEDQKTGSIYNFKREEARNANPAGEWNDYEIRFEDGTYTITLNGEVVNTWTNTSDQGRNRGYIGIQNHGDLDEVSFRDIRIQNLSEGEPGNAFDTIGITDPAHTANSQIFGDPQPYSFAAELMPPSGSVGVPPDDAFDDVPLRMPDTTGAEPNLASMNGQIVTLPEADRKVYNTLHFFGAATDAGPLAGGEFTLTFADDSTQKVMVQWRDWGNPGTATAQHHPVIGPMEYRHRADGVNDDPVPFFVYHVPIDVSSSQPLVSVTLPDGVTPPGSVIQAYLMALTLEDGGGGFEMPDLSGQLTNPDDATAPITAHALDPSDPTGEGGWYDGPVDVTLTATDEAGGSGVARTEYRIDGGAFGPYAGAFTISDDGAHTVDYRSIDEAGNVESTKSVQVKVDATRPTASAAVDPREPTAGEWYDTAVEITARGRDGSGSGVSSIEYRIGAGDWQAYDGPVRIADAGTYEVAFRATDAAGNMSEEVSMSVRVDATAPTTQAQLSGSGPVSVNLSASDGAGSGVEATEYRVDGGAWTGYTGAFSVSGLGAHRVDYRSSDVAGNLENAKEIAFTIGGPPQGGGGGGGGGGDGSDRPAPEPEPFVAIHELDSKRVSMRALTRAGLRVTATCAGADRGTARLQVSRKAARTLGLRNTTLAGRSVACRNGLIRVTLKPAGRVKRALQRAQGTVRATLVLRVADGSVASTDRQPLTLKGR